MGNGTYLNNLLQCFYAANQLRDADQQVPATGQAAQAPSLHCALSGLGDAGTVRRNPHQALEQLYSAFEQSERSRLGKDAHIAKDLAREIFKNAGLVTVENVSTFRKRLDSAIEQHVEKQKQAVDTMLSKESTAPIPSLSPESADKLYDYLQAQASGVHLPTPFTPEEEAVIQQYNDAKQYFRSTTASLEEARNALDPKEKDYAQQHEQIGTRLQTLWTESSEFTLSIMDALRQARGRQPQRAGHQRSASMSHTFHRVSSSTSPHSPMQRSLSSVYRPTLERSGSKRQSELASSIAKLRAGEDSDSSDDEVSPQMLPTRPRMFLSGQSLRQLRQKKAPNAQQGTGMRSRTILPPQARPAPVITPKEQTDSIANSFAEKTTKISFADATTPTPAYEDVERSNYKRPPFESATALIDYLTESLDLVYQDGEYDFVTDISALKTLTDELLSDFTSEFTKEDLQNIQKLLALPVFANLDTQDFATSKAENTFRRSLHALPRNFRDACLEVDRLTASLETMRATVKRQTDAINYRRRHAVFERPSHSTPQLRRLVSQQQRLVEQLRAAEARMEIAKKDATPEQQKLRSDYETAQQQRALLSNLQLIQKQLQRVHITDAKI
ncbi:MAG: hypothetical protein MI749_06800 [Desulfovibrionales bacterium]|nr:hypothetical protein [Desulfovibrionales bacterium]